MIYATGDQAPANPAKIAEAGIPFAFTTKGLKKKTSFYTHLKKAVAYGLNETTALAALTTRPAQLLGKDQRIGYIEKRCLRQLHCDQWSVIRAVDRNRRKLEYKDSSILLN